VFSKHPAIPEDGKIITMVRRITGFVRLCNQVRHRLALTVLAFKHTTFKLEPLLFIYLPFCKEIQTKVQGRALSRNVPHCLFVLEAKVKSQLVCLLLQRTHALSTSLNLFRFSCYLIAGGEVGD
jgi:hypothetical protein